VTLDSKREALLESLRKVVSEASELVYARTSFSHRNAGN